VFGSHFGFLLHKNGIKHLQDLWFLVLIINMAARQNFNLLADLAGLKIFNFCIFYFLGVEDALCH
jgi:hypothetical protein